MGIETARQLASAKGSGGTYRLEVRNQLLPIVQSPGNSGNLDEARAAKPGYSVCRLSESN
jgi:hypothetical protein